MQELQAQTAYVDDEPAGWVAVEPQTAYPKLRTSRVPWSDRDFEQADVRRRT